LKNVCITDVVFVEGDIQRNIGHHWCKKSETKNEFTSKFFNVCHRRFKIDWRQKVSKIHLTYLQKKHGKYFPLEL